MLKIVVLTTLLFISYTNAVQKIKSPLIKLNDGKEIPFVGLGTWKLNNRQTYRAVRDAISAGYRHIDTAYKYNNEIGVGAALRHLISMNQISRDDVFVTSKVWNTFHGRARAVEGIKLSLKNLGLDYLDLALIHWPTGFKNGVITYPTFPNGSVIPSEEGIVETWKGMEDAYKLGLTKSIGVSNFNSEQLARVLTEAEIKPAVNQVECHPYLNQQNLINYCQNNSIAVEAYSPLRQADRELFKDPVLKEIAAKHNKTVAQVALRWQIQRGVVVIPKTSKKTRMIENIDIFDFEISNEDIQKICKINKNKRLIDVKESITHPEYPFAITY